MLTFVLFKHDTYTYMYNAKRERPTCNRMYHIAGNIGSLWQSLTEPPNLNPPIFLQSQFGAQLQFPATCIILWYEQCTYKRSESYNKLSINEAKMQDIVSSRTPKQYGLKMHSHSTSPAGSYAGWAGGRGGRGRGKWKGNGGKDLRVIGLFS